MKPRADASLGKQRCRPRTTRNRHARSAARSSRPRRTRWSCTPLLDRLTSMRPARRQRRCCAHRRRACRGRAAPIEAATGPCQTSKTRARGPIWAWSAARTPPTEAAWTATFLFRSVAEWVWRPLYTTAILDFYTLSLSRSGLRHDSLPVPYSTSRQAQHSTDPERRSIEI